METAVYKASHYTDGDISTIYEICGCVDKDDVYAGATFVPSKEQVPEIQASLLLCPKHPKANAWRKSLSRAADRAALEKSGRTFASGVYLVGKQIKPGTYVVTGDIENCYWERQDRTGNIIQNNFVLAARRVEVTIRSSDYAFSSQGCGQWKPA